MRARVRKKAVVGRGPDHVLLSCVQSVRLTVMSRERASAGDWKLPEMPDCCSVRSVPMHVGKVGSRKAWFLPSFYNSRVGQLRGTTRILMPCAVVVAFRQVSPKFMDNRSGNDIS